MCSDFVIGKLYSVMQPDLGFDTLMYLTEQMDGDAFIAVVFRATHGTFKFEWKFDQHCNFGNACGIVIQYWHDLWYAKTEQLENCQNHWSENLIGSFEINKPNINAWLPLQSADHFQQNSIAVGLLYWGHAPSVRIRTKRNNALGHSLGWRLYSYEWTWGLGFEHLWFE